MSVASSSPLSSPFLVGTTLPTGHRSPSDSIRFKNNHISASATTTRERSTSSSSQYLCFNNMISSSSSTLYELLGISMGASCKEIKSAYRNLARVCHPDVVEIDRRDDSADHFMKIHAAYSTLSDPQKRADYDRNLFVTRRRPSSTPMSSSTYSYTGRTSSRNWETDQCW